MIGEFVAAVRNGTLPETVCADNIQSLATVFAAIGSAEAGARLAINA